MSLATIKERALVQLERFADGASAPTEARPVFGHLAIVCSLVLVIAVGGLAVTSSNVAQWTFAIIGAVAFSLLVAFAVLSIITARPPDTWPPNDED